MTDLEKAETEKYFAERKKLLAEDPKLLAEALKLDHDRRFGWLQIVTAIAAVIAAVGTLINVIHH